MEDSRINVGVIGLGYISQYWIAAIKKNLRYKLVAVCDIAEKAIKLYSQEGIAIYSDYHQLLQNDDVSAIIVCLPNVLHYKVSRDALLANKHVCCEKPLTVTLADAEELSKLSFEQKVVLFGAFHRRYNKNLFEMIDKLKSMPIVQVEGNYLENVEKHVAGAGCEWYVKMKSAGGGCIMVAGPNIYDTIVQFLGHLEVTKVHIKQAHDYDIDIMTTIELISDQGIPVIVHLDWMYQGEKKNMIVKFQDGTECVIDMLAGSQSFKSSLWHEYEGVIDDFYSRIQCCKVRYDEKILMKNIPTSNAVNLDLHGAEAVDIVRLVCDTYAKANEQVNILCIS